jgi:hypothetical protein
LSVCSRNIWRSHGCLRFPGSIALDNCRKVLDHSLGIGLPVTFIRMLNKSAFFNGATPFVRWIEGFEPYRNEMGFGRASPCCYSCKPFTALAKQSRGGIVLAGFAGESACRSTSMQANDHRAVSKISGIYGDVYETADWISTALPRKLGHGKSASG